MRYVTGISGDNVRLNDGVIVDKGSDLFLRERVLGYCELGGIRYFKAVPWVSRNTLFVGRFDLARLALAGYIVKDGDKITKYRYKGDLIIDTDSCGVTGDDVNAYASVYGTLTYLSYGGFCPMSTQPGVFYDGAIPGRVWLWSVKDLTGGNVVTMKQLERAEEEAFTEFKRLLLEDPKEIEYIPRDPYWVVKMYGDNYDAYEYRNWNVFSDEGRFELLIDRILACDDNVLLEETLRYGAEFTASVALFRLIGTCLDEGSDLYSGLRGAFVYARESVL